MAIRAKHLNWHWLCLGFLLVAVSLGLAQPGLSQGDVLYVPSHQGLGLIEIDLAEGGARRIAKTALFNNSLVVVNQARRELCVAASNGDTVSVVDLDSFREIATIKGDVGWNTNSMVVSRDGRNLYLGCSQIGDQQFSRVVAFDLALRRHVATALLANVSAPVFLALSPNGHTLYVSWRSFLDEYAAPRLQLLRRQNYPDWTSSQVALSSDGESLFVAQAGRLLRWRADKSTIESTIALPEVSAYSRIQLSRDGTAVFVPGNSAIYRVPTSMRGYLRIRPPAPRTNSPFEFAESGDGRTLYVLSGIELADLWIIDVSSQRLKQTIGGVPNPASVLAVPSTAPETATRTSPATASPVAQEPLAADASALPRNPHVATPKLPDRIKRLLDARYPGWKLSDVSEESQRICMDKNSPFLPSLVWGDFTGNGQMDYAVRITYNRKSMVIAFLALMTREGTLFDQGVLDTYPDGLNHVLLSVSRKGGKYYDHDRGAPGTYPNDTVKVVFCQQGAASFIFDKSRFLKVIVSD